MGNLIASKRASNRGEPYHLTPREEMIDKYGPWVVKYLQDWDRWTGKKYSKRGTFKPKAWEALWYNHRGKMTRTNERDAWSAWMVESMNRTDDVNTFTVGVKEKKTPDDAAE